MKTIYFVRHAKSSWDHPMLQDFDRPLNPRGLRDAPFMGKLLHAKGAKPDVLISSPAQRALHTARFFAEAMGHDPDSVQQEPQIYEAYPETIFFFIQALPNEHQEIFLFGHNPTWTSLANQFSEEFLSNIPTCGVFKVEAAVDDWAAFTRHTGALTAFHFPKQYFS